MSTVEVVRGGVVESRHAVHVAVCDEEGRLRGATGDVERVTYYRSAAKPMQAVPLVEEGVADRLGLTAEELALCCASHEGEPRHVEGARSILAKAGVAEGLLACGAHAPFSAAAARALSEEGRGPGRIHNNCSGKHAGMLALAVGMGWDPVGYHEPGHPVQRRMAREIGRWTGLPSTAIGTGIDGCGVVCFAVPLRDMASSFARFSAAARTDSGPSRVVGAIVEHPFMVGGTDRACTDVTAAAGGRLFVKLGAEGVYGAGWPERGLGIAIKVEDGGRRAVEVALVEVLSLLGALSAEEVEGLERHARPAIRNTRDEEVGKVRPRITLSEPAREAAAPCS